MSWLQLRISCEPKAAKQCESAMLGNGALSITFEDNADQPIFEPELGETPLWNETRVTGLFEADTNTQAIEANVRKALIKKKTHLHWHVLEDKDWEREWMSHYAPLQCHDRLWICPSWTAPPDPKATNLMLDPGLAFGTGTHPTTFLCLQWLAGQNLTDKHVIDYGCGSGILGIAALLLGAQQACGVDIDPQALLATQDNVQRNELDKSRFPVYFPEKCPNKPADYVFANILAGPLVELAPKLLALIKNGGTLCLSGILKVQQQSITEAYQDALDIHHIGEKDGWICIVGQKKTDTVKTT